MKTLKTNLQSGKETTGLMHTFIRPHQSLMKTALCNTESIKGTTLRQTLYSCDKPDSTESWPGQVHTTSGLLSLSGFTGLLQVPEPAWKTVRSCGFCRKLLSQPYTPLTEPYRPIHMHTNYTRTPSLRSHDSCIEVISIRVPNCRHVEKERKMLNKERLVWWYGLFVCASDFFPLWKRVDLISLSLLHHLNTMWNIHQQKYSLPKAWPLDYN